jgi:hypothetical protein
MLSKWMRQPASFVGAWTAMCDALFPARNRRCTTHDELARHMLGTHRCSFMQLPFAKLPWASAAA